MERERRETVMLRRLESAELISSIEDPITRNLMSAASYCIISRFMENKDLPIADFDLGFFSEAMLKLCGNHKLLRAILDGEDVGWFDETPAK